MLRFVISADNPSTIHYSDDLKGFSRVCHDIYYERYADDSGNQIRIKIIAEVRNKATIKEDLLEFPEVLKSAYNIDLKLKGYIREERRQFSGLACDWRDIERIVLILRIISWRVSRGIRCSLRHLRQPLAPKPKKFR